MGVGVGLRGGVPPSSGQGAALQRSGRRPPAVRAPPSWPAARRHAGPRRAPATVQPLPSLPRPLHTPPPSPKNKTPTPQWMPATWPPPTSRRPSPWQPPTWPPSTEPPRPGMWRTCTRRALVWLRGGFRFGGREVGGHVQGTRVWRPCGSMVVTGMGGGIVLQGCVWGGGEACTWCAWGMYIMHMVHASVEWQ